MSEFDPSIVPDAQKIKIVLDSSPISVDQVNFPLTIKLDTSNLLHAPLFADLGLNSKKISIESGGVQCPVEIESWSVSKAILHTKVPAYSALVDTELVLSWDSAQTDNMTYVSVTGAANTEIFPVTNNLFWAGGTYGTTSRVIIPADKFSVTQNQLRIKFSRVSTSYTMANMFVGQPPVSAAQPYYFDGNQVPVLYNGSASITVATNGQLSDPVDITIDPTRPIIISFYSVVNASAYTTTIPAGGAAYYDEGQNINSASENEPVMVPNPSWMVVAAVIGISPSKQVWDKNFIAVFHMAQDPSVTSTMLDSTVNGNNATMYNITKNIDGRLVFNGSNSYANIPHNASLNSTELTIECIVNPTATVETVILSKCATKWDQNTGYYLDLRSNAAKWLFLITSTKYFDAWIGDSFNVETYAAFTNAASIGKVYYNGSIAGTSSLTPVVMNTDAITIGKLTTAGTSFFKGSMKSIRISSIARSADWIKATNLSLRSLLVTFSTYDSSDLAVIIGILSQKYDLESAQVLASLLQKYDVLGAVIAQLEQPYAETIEIFLKQKYGNYGEVTTTLEQYYGDMDLPICQLVQKYGDLALVIAALKQRYSLNELLFAAIIQKYSIVEAILPRELKQIYDILDRNQYLTILQQKYSMYPDSTPIARPVVWVSIGGVKVDVIGIDYDYDLDSYAGVFMIQLAKRTDWISTDYKQEVITHIQGVEHHQIVVEKNDSQSINSSTYTIEARSPAVELDFPFASQVPEDFVVSGTASQIVNSLAALEGKSITWQMASDPPLTINEIQVAGDSPLNGIRSIVNELGGRIQSLPDGSIWAVKRHPVNSNEYDIAATDYELTTGQDFIVLSTNSDKRYGYNKYTISSDTTTSEYNLKAETITTSRIDITASKVPWSSDYVALYTSELTNVEIIAKGIIEEEVVETIEIIGGSGSLGEPCYGGVSWDYGSRTDLGGITVAEDGTVTTNIAGESMVEITYTTRFWKWETSDSDSEKVQFILVKP